MADWTPITDEEAAQINAARDTLADIRQRSAEAIGDKMTYWKTGRMSFACDEARDALAAVLSHASAYGADLSDDVILNRKTEV